MKPSQSMNMGRLENKKTTTKKIKEINDNYKWKCYGVRLVDWDGNYSYIILQF